jgi:Tfp pilus assembly protein PilV
MMLRFASTSTPLRSGGFSLIEVLIAFLVFTLTMSGLIYGYVQANRMAEWSSMSLAAQSYAQQGMEQMRSAQWNAQIYPPTNGPGTQDELPMVNGLYQTNEVNTLDVPTTSASISVTNFITVTTVTNDSHTLLRQIRSDVVWTMPLDGKVCTNTAITLRAPD